VRAILDTSVVIASDVPPLEGELAVSMATLAELYFGILIAKNAETRGERLRRLTHVERNFNPIPIDQIVARSYGYLASLVSEAGRQPRARVMDLLIAATAYAHQARLYTRNSSDLRGLESKLEIVAV
jgi:predicted nucleic acid-binding protein